MHKRLAALALLAMPVAVWAVAPPAAAQDADDYRGGWETGHADPHIYEFSIRGTRVRGIYCTHCDDATTLAFVDGTLGPGGLRCIVTHVRDDGSTAYVDHLSAQARHGELIVNGTSGAPGAAHDGHFSWTLHKDPRSPAPLVFVPVQRLPRGSPPVAPLRPRGPIRPPAPYQQPGPWERLTAARVAGVWLGFGAGIDKQFFIIRRVGDRLRGMVCGPCDNPWTMAALDDFSIDADTLHFNILHEDWGDADSNSGIPFYKHVTAHISQNEMRAVFRADHPPKEYALLRGGADVGASLMGPVAVEATAGND
ncbi:MAG TPA: hypothetical protein VMD56_11130 [Steroidobacteraceae bacterium]|nr:hypothetical protein [Steroidobacteraceae bacterium]